MLVWLTLLGASTLGDVSPVAGLRGFLGLVTARCRMGRTNREMRELAAARQEARTDELTGLANRRRLYEQVDALLEEQPPRAAAMLLLDLDRFQEVNDGFGHRVGDQLLHELAARMQAALRSSDLMVRLGGDEFAALLLDAGESEALEVAKRLSDEVERVVVIGDLSLRVSASIGIALYPQHGTDVDTLLRRADTAMYACKQEHLNSRLWAPGARDDDNWLLLREQLRAALHTDELVLHYQPKIHLASGRVRGVEALVRWQHPQLGLLPPDRFLPIAESTGLIAPLTTVVLGVALRQCRAWRDQGLDLSVAVNLSPPSLLDPDLPMLVLSLLEHLRLPRHALELEITETVLLGQRQRACATLEQLRTHGVRVALDDYGTGYSSLAYLSQLPLDELKLDKSFIQALGATPRDEAIVRSTVELAHALGLTLVAEGVENADVLRELVTFGCDSAQGYHLARPSPAETLTPWLHEHAEHRVHTAATAIGY